MNVNSLEQMESIVDNNNSLSWDGWTVIEQKTSPAAWMNKDGAYKNGKWVLQKRYELSTDGWTIPNKLATNGQQG